MRLSIASAIWSGVGGQPGIMRSTGSTSDTGPAKQSGDPRVLMPSAQLPRAATRRGSGIAW